MRLTLAWKINLIVLGGLVVLLGSSIVSSLWQGGAQTEARIRVALTGAVAAAHEVVDPGFVASAVIAQVETDPTYSKTNDALKRLATAFGLSDLYVMRHVGDQWVFVFDTKDGPYNTDKTDFVVYEEPPPEVDAAAKAEAPIVTAEPYTDEYGTFRSAFLFLSHPSMPLVIGADFDVAQLMAAREIEFVIAAGLALGGLILAAVLAMILSRTVGRPVRQVSSRFALLTGATADLTQRIEIMGSGELAELASGFNSFVEKLSLLVADLQSGVGETAEIQVLLQTRSNETEVTVERAGQGLAGLNASGERLESTMTRVLGSLDDIVAAVASLETLVKHQEGSAERAADDHGALDKAALELRTEASEVGTALGLLEKESAENVTRMEEGLAALRQLEGAVAAVNGITATLGETAETIGLLAMNASIEAAHAGIEGRGFSVIADTMRKLADSSKAEAARIGRTLSDMLSFISSASAAVANTAAGAQNAQQGLDRAAGQVRKLSAAAGGLEDFTSRSRAAVEALREDWAGVAQVSQAVADGTRSIVLKVREAGDVSEVIRNESRALLEDTDRFGEVARDVRDVADRLTRVSQVLQDNMQRFKTT